jgi:UDP:flavonoid glycosyltransferase YjiC (YdhE family)
MATLGSAGDVYPFLALGRALRARGHAVTLVSYAAFEDAALAVGMGFAPLQKPVKAAKDTSQYFEGLAGLLYAAVAPLTRPWRRLARASAMLYQVRPVFERLAAGHVAGRTVVVASCFALGARVFEDAVGVPAVTVHLAPVTLRSAHRPAVQPPLRLPAWTPRCYRRAAYRLLDRLVLDPLLARPVNAFRRGLGLAPVRGIMGRWLQSPRLGLALFPPWFAAPQPDWPPHVRLTGFPLYDGDGPAELPAAVEVFLAAGPAPVVITPTSEARFSQGFFRGAVRACARLGRRGLLLTRFREQVPDPLPRGFCHADYLPFSRILPRAAALVHHGGIGSASQALAAGIPQVVVPLKHDQFDNAARLRDLGVAAAVPLSRASAGVLEAALGALLTCPAVAQRCRDLARRFDPVADLARSCDLIEGVLSAPRGDAGPRAA